MADPTLSRPCTEAPAVQLERCHDLLSALAETIDDEHLPAVAALHRQVAALVDAYDHRLHELAQTVRTIVTPLEVAIDMANEGVRRAIA